VTHEDFGRRYEQIMPSSNRSFGLVIATFLLGSTRPIVADSRWAPA
jgi:hypothetical protein